MSDLPVCGAGPLLGSNRKQAVGRVEGAFDPLPTSMMAGTIVVMTNDWLADIVIVNESRDEATAGDVSVFRSAGEARNCLEHWWVDRSEGFAFTAAGHRLTLGVDEERRVIVTRQQDAPAGTELVRGWLRAQAAAVLDVRRSRAREGKATLSRSEEQGLLPTSVEGLIAYIGFNT